MLGLTISLANLYAQGPIPVVDKMLKDSINENLDRNTDQFGLLDIIRRQTKNTRDEVADTRKLQYNYWAFLQQTTSTAALTVSDATADQEAAGQVISTAQHLGDYSFATDLSEVFQAQAEPMQKSQALYERLIPYDENLVFTELASWETYQKVRQRNVTALEEMSARRQLQLAKTYQHLANSKIEKAAELRVLLTTDRQFSMTERERLEILAQMQRALQESQQLRSQADQLMQQVTQTPLTKTRALHAYEKQQERNTMASTPVHQN